MRFAVPVMVSLRGVVPLFLTGTSGIALLAFGVGGLSGMDPQLQRAARTVEIRRSAPPATPDVTAPDTAAPDGTPQRATPSDTTLRDVDCPRAHDRAHRRGEV